MISGLGGSRAGFQLLGRLSRGSGQTRSDRLFSLIAGLWRLPGWIPASGLPLFMLRTDSTRSFVFDDFGSELLPDQSSDGIGLTKPRRRTCIWKVLSAIVRSSCGTGSLGTNGSSPGEVCFSNVPASG